MMRTWTADVINHREDLDKAVEGRGGTLGRMAPDVLVAGLRGSEAGEGLTAASVTNTVDYYRPRLVVWENVRGLASLRNERALQRMIDTLNTQGYCVAHATLDQAKFSRRSEYITSKRLWIVAADQQIDLPDPPKLPRQRIVEHAPGANPTLWAILAANGF